MTYATTILGTLNRKGSSCPSGNHLLNVLLESLVLKVLFLKTVLMAMSILSNYFFTISTVSITTQGEHNGSPLNHGNVEYMGRNKCIIEEA